MTHTSHLRRLRPLTPAGADIVAVLGDLEDRPGLTLNELAEASGHTRSQTGLALSKAEERGWVRSKRSLWRLTPAGRQERAPAGAGAALAA